MSLRRVGLALVSTIRSRPWLQAALLTALVLIVLSPSLGADFIWDDFRQIVESPTIGHWQQVPGFFIKNVMQSAGQEGRNAEGVDIYRPLFMLALTLIHTINGADSFWFHLACILVHTAVCLVLWGLTRRWLDTGGSDPSAAAAVVLVLFAFHPVTAEAYLWASAISETMAALGLLAAALLLDLWCRAGQTGRCSWLVAVLAGLCLLAGLLSKEVVITALPVLTLWLWRRRRVTLVWQLPLWVAAALFLVLRMMALGGMKATGAGAAQRLLAIRNLPVLLLDGLRAMLAMQPIGPRHLSYDYVGVTWGWSLLAGLVVIGLVLLAVRLRQCLPLLLVALGVLVSMLAPTSLVTTVPGWGGFARYLYLPWAFLALALTAAGSALLAWLASRRRHLLPAAAVIMVCYGVGQQLGLRQALHAYSSQENLARTSIAIAPQVPEGYEWLGNVYLERNDLSTALSYYQEAVQQAPGVYRPRNNLAACLLELGRPVEALQHLQILEQQHGATVTSSTSMVRALIMLRRWDSAAQHLLWSLQRMPDEPALLRLQRQLLREHAGGQQYRSWLADQLELPENRKVAGKIRPLLAEFQ
jgi:tetratricopeptide (TPR) repeat protein